MKNALRLAAASLATFATSALAQQGSPPPAPTMSISMSPTSIAIAVAATVGVAGSLWFFHKITK